MITKKTQWMVALSALSLMATVACGKKNNGAAPIGAVGADQCAAAYMNGYVNPALYPQCQPTNAYLYPNGQNPANGAYNNGAYNSGYNYNWNAQAQWQYQMQLQQAYYYNNLSRYYGSNCWNYNGMYYGYRISGGEVLWKAEPMTKDQLSSEPDPCEHPVKAELDKKGVLTVTDDKDEIVFSRANVEAVAQKCDQVRYSQEGKLYQYDAVTNVSVLVPTASIEEQKDEQALK